MNGMRPRFRVQLGLLATATARCWNAALPFYIERIIEWAAADPMALSIEGRL